MDTTNLTVSRAAVEGCVPVEVSTTLTATRSTPCSNRLSHFSSHAGNDKREGPHLHLTVYTDRTQGVPVLLGKLMRDSQLVPGKDNFPQTTITRRHLCIMDIEGEAFELPGNLETEGLSEQRTGEGEGGSV